MNINNELKIMHACELGAVGVYRGHKCVARYFFRANLSELDGMRFHEKSHADIFRNELVIREARTCHANQVFFCGGLLYGVFVGLFGLRAIGVSTRTIEGIVVHELDKVLMQLDTESALYNKIEQVKMEELAHKESGNVLANEQFWLARYVEKFASLGAYTAKHLASIL